MDEDLTNNTISRKPRSVVTLEILNTAWRLIYRGRSAKDISMEENWSLKTVYRLFKKINGGQTNEHILRNKKRRKTTPNLTAKATIINALQRDCSHAQRELADKLGVINTGRSQSSVSRILKDMEFTRKRLVKVPEKRNTTRTINARQEYCTIINQVDDERLVFLDETGVNLHHSRNYGYSPKNSKAIWVVRE
ncbi:hypothetical protein CDIK_1226 [Cucumispora dikerogammari]|nr:hypothetical protein CDIK_1226 [Cucumispora dikerogammari]